PNAAAMLRRVVGHASRERRRLGTRRRVGGSRIVGSDDKGVLVAGAHGDVLHGDVVTGADEAHGLLVGALEGAAIDEHPVGLAGGYEEVRLGVLGPVLVGD